MGRVVSVANQKGGVAKTTSVVNLATALHDAGASVLAVDLDSQACLTFSLGVDADAVQSGSHEVLMGKEQASDVILEVPDGPHLLPATLDLAAAETALASMPHRERVLQRALAGVRERYDVILMDCSPSLGLVTINAFVASDEVIVPMQCEMLSHRGVGQLLDTVDGIAEELNPLLQVRGVLPTMFDRRTGHAQAVLADVGERYQVNVLTPIPRSVRFAEAPGYGSSIVRTAPKSAGAQAYRQVAAELGRAWGLPG